MGNQPSRNNLHEAITYLNICADPIKYEDDKFWDRIWSHGGDSEHLEITIQEIRMLRDGSPKNFATLIFKMVEKIYLATKTLCNTNGQQIAVLNSTRILTKIIPCIFEDKQWRNFFLDNKSCEFGNNVIPDIRYPKKSNQQKDFRSYLPFNSKHDTSTLLDKGVDQQSQSDNSGDETISNTRLLLFDETSITTNDQIISKTTSFDIQDSLLKTLVLSCCDLLFCPEFTVPAHTDLSNNADNPPEDIQSLISCEYVWEPGVGFESRINSTTLYDKNRIDILRLVLTCFSETLYCKPSYCLNKTNHWIQMFTSSANRHALPLFTSLLNTLFGYKPSRLISLNNILFDDNRHELVELAAQILIVSMDYRESDGKLTVNDKISKSKEEKNLFLEYLTRIHRVEDMDFMIDGFKWLLNDQLVRGYLLSSSLNINLEQELLVLLWRINTMNKRFVNHLMKSHDVLEIIVPILYHINLNFQNHTKTALIHLGVFNLLLFSGDRNFSVRLNKHYQTTVLTNLPGFTGSHADLMIIVFHKLILYGFNIYQLFDYMTTIILNISPYIKCLSMVASKCLVQLFEIFSSPEIIFTEPNYHQMVTNFLEIFNNIIQYQFDGNASLVCAILSRKEPFINLKYLPTSEIGVRRVLNKLSRTRDRILFMANIDTSNEDYQRKANDESLTCNNESNGSNNNINTLLEKHHTYNDKKSITPVSVDAEKPLKPTSQLITNAIISSSTTSEDSRSSSNDGWGVCLVATPIIWNVIQTTNPIDSSTSNDVLLSNIGVKSGTQDQTIPNTHNQMKEEVKLVTPSNNKIDFEKEVVDILDGICSLNDSDVTPIQESLKSTLKECENTKNTIPNLQDLDQQEVTFPDEIDNVLKKNIEINELEEDEQNSIDEEKKRNDFCNKSDDQITNSSHSSSTETTNDNPSPIDKVNEIKTNIKWRPSPEFLANWKASLPLHTTLKTIECLSRQLDKVRKDNPTRVMNETEIIKFVQKGTLVGLLPVPHPILIRKYRSNEETDSWFKTCTWAIIYVKTPIWLGTAIKLIRAYHPPT